MEGSEVRQEQISNSGGFYTLYLLHHDSLLILIFLLYHSSNYHSVSFGITVQNVLSIELVTYRFYKSTITREAHDYYCAHIPSIHIYLQTNLFPP